MKVKIKNRLVSLLWAVGAVALAVVLVIAAVLICTVRILKPEKLTPMVENIANKMVDAKVGIERVGLDFHPAFPVLRLRVDGISVISEKFTSVPDSVRDKLPSYSDSLLSVEHIEGSLDIARYFASGEIALRDVLIESPSANIVIAPHGVANFDIYRASGEVSPEPVDAEEASLPSISINHFEIKNCREFRYFNAVDSTDVSIVLLDAASIDGRRAPDYRLKIGGIFHNPAAKEYLALDGLTFGADGVLRWVPERPLAVVLEDFRLSSGFLDVDFKADLDFSRDLIVRSGSLTMDSVDLSGIISVLPEDMRMRYRLEKPFFSTDAMLSFSGELTRPFDASRDTVPYADFKIVIPESRLDYGRTHLRKMALSMDGSLKGNNLDEATVRVSDLTVAGPATEIHISALLSELMSDPAFDCKLNGSINLDNLPEIVLQKLDGYVSGCLNADLAVDGKASMFSVDAYHKLDVSGTLDGSNLYWLSGDTANMVDIGHVAVDFDSNRRIVHDGNYSDRLMSAKITADTASMLFGGVELNIGDLSLSAAVQNASAGIDTSAIIPVGGGLSLGSLRVVSVTDKSGLRMKGLSGRVMMHRYKKDAHIPEFILKVNADRLAAGGDGTVGMLADAAIYVKAHKIPEREERRRRMKSTVDSLGRIYPDLPADSVLALAIEKRRKGGARKQKRVRLEENDDFESIDWGASKGLRRFLNDWVLDGEISTRQARLYSPYFPLRNHINLLDITFSTDTVNIKSLRYKAGRSDMAVTGLVSNIKKSFGSKRTDSPLKINFDIESDTIDVNELAVAAFAGSAHAGGDSHSASVGFSIDDTSLENGDDVAGTEERKESSPILVPYNIDANIGLGAHNILYSDLVMKNLRGDILVFDGAVNLHDLSAQSDAGSLSLSALYSAPNTRDMQFGFGMVLDDFKIEKFLKLVPAVDSIMPLMRDFSGTIDADLAATVRLDSAMNFELPSLDAAIKLQGDSLALINPETYRTLGKWLRFKDKADNTIKHMDVEFIVKDNKMELFPFTFDIDRYKLGVVGYNDLALNFDYHISVLKSPLPFKFGINVKGNPDKYKVRFGGAKLKEGMTFSSVAVVDTVRVNLVRQIQNVFRRGVSNSRFARLDIGQSPDLHILSEGERSLSHADSVAMIKEGYIDAPVPEESQAVADKANDKNTKKKTRKIKKNKDDARGKDD